MGEERGGVRIEKKSGPFFKWGGFFFGWGENINKWTVQYVGKRRIAKKSKKRLGQSKCQTKSQHRAGFATGLKKMEGKLGSQRRRKE